MKLGQTWQIDKRTFEAYQETANQEADRRFGPKHNLFQKANGQKEN